METSQRNKYLGIETDPNESKRFKIQLAICLLIVGVYAALLFTHDTRNRYMGNHQHSALIKMKMQVNPADSFLNYENPIHSIRSQ